MSNKLDADQKLHNDDVAALLNIYYEHDRYFPMRMEVIWCLRDLLECRERIAELEKKGG